MLNNEQRTAWKGFLESVEADDLLDPRDRLLVCFAAALALDCGDCLYALIDQSPRVGVSREALDAVETQVMRMAALHKQSGAERAFREYDARRDPY